MPEDSRIRDRLSIRAVTYTPHITAPALLADLLERVARV